MTTAENVKLKNNKQPSHDSRAVQLYREKKAIDTNDISSPDTRKTIHLKSHHMTSVE